MRNGVSVISPWEPSNRVEWFMAILTDVAFPAPDYHDFCVKSTTKDESWDRS